MLMCSFVEKPQLTNLTFLTIFLNPTNSPNSFSRFFYILAIHVDPTVSYNIFKIVNYMVQGREKQKSLQE